MGSLAGMLRESGYRVTGSDARVYPPMSDFLRAAGIDVMEGFDAGGLSPPPDLVVIGNAVSRGNVEVEATLDQRLPFASLPEVLRDLYLRQADPIVVTGTHGKTTATAMIAHLLSQGGLDPSFLIAGLTLDFPRPFHLGSGPHFIIEGDEYDSAFFAKQAKFLSYLPQVVLINNIEYDHADIYPDLEHIKTSFRQLINIVPAAGLIVANHDDPVVGGLLPRSLAPVQTFGLSPSADWYATKIETRGRRVSFTVCRQGSELERFELPLSGLHNVRNALGAIAIATHAGLEASTLAAALGSFKGVQRRQQVIAEAAGITLIDDFAHHPTAVDETLAGLRQAYPDSRLWAVFEPASASNAKRIFEERYVAALGRADRVILAAVPRPERSGDEEPFSPKRVAEALLAAGTEALFVADIEGIAQQLDHDMHKGDVIVFMSNGGFGGIQRTVCDLLNDRVDTGTAK
jgi:UDP-N-acetylmuramate: L-alanyl-gamma-D-glutamyl-meso-diaminopimelate ligase